MNKEQRKILFRKILPKSLLVLIILSGVIFFILLKDMGNKAEVETNEYMENGGIQAIEIMNKYGLITIDKLTIKYPQKYKITDKYSKEEIGGGYTLMSEYPKDELTFSYYKKKSLTITSVDNAIHNLEIEILKDYNTDFNLSKIITEKIGVFDVRIREINYNEKKLYIYGFQSENYYFVFASHLKYFLNAIIQNL